MIIGVYFNYRERGPGKVVDNLLKGFDLCDIEYRINSDGDKNLILQNCDRLYGDISNCLLGPNICTLPIDNKYVMNHKSYDSLIVPSRWVKDLYKRWIPEDKIKIWAVGIDIDKFSDKSKFYKKYDFLIYLKRRDVSDLKHVINILNSLKKKYVVVEYGKYTEVDFIKCIEESKFGMVIGNCESQGIAIQEMMSCNLPLLVWDVKEWKDRGKENICKSTSIPYWDDSCGRVFYNLKEALDEIINIQNGIYDPRKFILENLKIENKAIELTRLFQ